MAHQISVVIAGYALLRRELRLVVVMDLTMPVMDGIQATRRILERNRNAAVLMLSMSCSGSCIRKALDAGATGYLVKDAVDLDLATAVKNVATRKQVVCQVTTHA